MTEVYGEGVARVGVRPITEKIHWIQHSIGPGADAINRGFAADFARANPKMDPTANDIIYSSYLFMDDKTFLIDTLAPAQREGMLQALNDLLAGRKLDYLWISHTELPHAGNLDAIRRAHPEVRILTVGGHDHYEVHGFEDAQLLNFGDKLALGEHEIEIIEPLFVDHALTQWLYEPRAKFLCPVDWALMVNTEHQSFRFMDEMEEIGYSPAQFEEDISTTSRFVFPWLRWADPDATEKAVEAFFERYDVEIFAPSHTNVIRKDAPKYMAALQRAMRRAVAGTYDLVY